MTFGCQCLVLSSKLHISWDCFVFLFFMNSGINVCPWTLENETTAETFSISCKCLDSSWKRVNSNWNVKLSLTWIKQTTEVLFSVEGIWEKWRSWGNCHMSLKFRKYTKNKHHFAYFKVRTLKKQTLKWLDNLALKNEMCVYDYPKFGI